MKCSFHWRRLKEDTIGGHKIEVRTVYSSMMKNEIDNLEKQMEETWGKGIIVTDAEADIK